MAGGMGRKERRTAVKGSLITVSFFVAGVLCGRQPVTQHIPQLEILSLAALCALLFSVAFSLGSHPEALRRFTRLSPRLALLPLATITGTLTGCMLTGILLPERSLTDCLSVGSGMGYYSLSSILITGYRGTELGTVALLANILREITALLAAPLLARWFGHLAPMAVGGATSMDTTLPVSVRYAGNEYAPLAVYHGFVTDSSVFFLVTLFCNL